MSLPEKILSRKDEITRDFLKLVDDHVNDLLNQKAHKRFSASDFAALLFIAPRHLTNTTKLTIHKSPCDVMEERLLLEAQLLLKNTTVTVAEIAYRFGYSDSTNFIKFFKGMYGKTPLQYRKQIKTN